VAKEVFQIASHLSIQIREVLFFFHCKANKALFEYSVLERACSIKINECLSLPRALDDHITKT